MYVLYGFLHTFFICIYTQFGEQLSLQSQRLPISHTQKRKTRVSLPFENPERKGQDSNLRTSFAGYTLSRRASSTTRAPFRRCFRFESGAKVSKNADMFQTILVFFCLRAMVLSFGIVRLLSTFCFLRRNSPVISAHFRGLRLLF